MSVVRIGGVGCFSWREDTGENVGAYLESSELPLRMFSKSSESQ